jgi:hypothetical protein
MSGHSNKFRALCALFDRDYLPSDCPKIPADDPLLAALKLAHGEAGRPDLAIPRTTMTPNR